MSDRFQIWWRERSPREQSLLAIMLALLAAVLLWLLIVRPLMGALDQAKLRHGEAVIVVAEARGQADRSRRSNGAQGTPALPIDALISGTATEAGFTGARVAGQGPSRAAVTIDSARAPAYFAWVAELERQGLVVESLRARANADRTLTTQTLLGIRNR